MVSWILDPGRSTSNPYLPGASSSGMHFVDDDEAVADEVGGSSARPSWA